MFFEAGSGILQSPGPDKRKPAFFRQRRCLMASQPPTPDTPIEEPVDDPIASPEDPPVYRPDDPVETPGSVPPPPD
jgi:hypothetical protein